ncbi:ribosome silencing factor [Rarobacter incanus]|uniref:Ribosomal silencing factor RsfS n=1 Tax=Rarobacter incanus TaxID=153494 RepID=A0A542SN11_9MICO|nr:ribosome silencing factor [Rarobacter incanus]TQK76021.1 ribosome-associated protein [Rarobacter incanus]
MTATDRAIELTIAAARAASEKKAQQVIALDVSEVLVLTDVFVIASGRNQRQVKAIVDAVEEALHKLGAKPIRREGLAEAHWVLLDFGDIVVHVQQEADREFYALERLWKDCPEVELPEDARGGDGDTSEYDDYDQFGFYAGTYQAGGEEPGAAE